MGSLRPRRTGRALPVRLAPGSPDVYAGIAHGSGEGEEVEDHVPERPRSCPSGRRLMPSGVLEDVLPHQYMTRTSRHDCHITT